MDQHVTTSRRQELNVDNRFDGLIVWRPIWRGGDVGEDSVDTAQSSVQRLSEGHLTLWTW